MRTNSVRGNINSTKSASGNITRSFSDEWRRINVGRNRRCEMPLNRTTTSSGNSHNNFASNIRNRLRFTNGEILTERWFMFVSARRVYVCPAVFMFGGQAMC